MHIYLDATLRRMPAGYMYRAASAIDAIQALQAAQVSGSDARISFDAGELDAGTPDAGALEVAKWIEVQAYTNPDFVVPDWHVHAGDRANAGTIHRCMLSASRGPAPTARLERRDKKMSDWPI